MFLSECGFHNFLILGIELKIDEVAKKETNNIFRSLSKGKENVNDFPKHKNKNKNSRMIGQNKQPSYRFVKQLGGIIQLIGSHDKIVQLFSTFDERSDSLLLEMLK